jgi:hypothetical protein
MDQSVVWHAFISLAYVGSSTPHRERTFNGEGMQKWNANDDKGDRIQ